MERIVVGADPGWFHARPTGSVHDFFELFEHSLDAAQAGARAIEAAGGALSGGSVEHHAHDVRELVRCARAGDWQPLEYHLRNLGSRYAWSGLAFPAWLGIATRFYDAIVARAVARYAAEPGRLTALLHVLAEYMERSLSLIADSYHAVKAELERDIAARHAAEQQRAEAQLARSAARLEILSGTSSRRHRARSSACSRWWRAGSARSSARAARSG
jgi:hypothetical protein